MRTREKTNAILEEYQAKLDETRAILNKPSIHTTEELKAMIQKMIELDKKENGQW